MVQTMTTICFVSESVCMPILPMIVKIVTIYGFINYMLFLILYFKVEDIEKNCYYI
jgi:hypothetical protein